MSEARAPAISAGSRLGPYEILSLLGAGGMGEVYRARDARLGRDVAVKVLSPGVAADEERLRRFELEARATGALNHPNILAVFDIGTHEGAPYVVSELLEGDTLRARLGGGPLPTKKVLDYAAQIARGLAAAHEKGIVHRDLKPENLFVTRDGRLKILDFGLAKLARPEAPAGATDAATVSQQTDSGTVPGTIMGTAGYMSPEQVRGLSADHRSDIFSFGAILYEMVSGRRAFKGATAADTMSAILREDPPELSSGGRALPPGLERIMRRCIEKDQEERFQSAKDLTFNLEALSGASDVTVAAAAMPARQVRVPRLTAVLAVLAALGVGVFAGRPFWERPPLRFKQVTFRRGTVSAARFAPDGQTVVYSAGWEGRPLAIFSTRPESRESRDLGLPGADLLSISALGEMAIALDPGPASALPTSGTLARVPLSGGAPREVLNDVPGADWGPDGASLVAVRSLEGKWQVEFPLGKVLYETDAFLCCPRVSPKGDRVAFIEYGAGDLKVSSLVMVDRQRRKTVLFTGDIQPGLAWSPGGEVWFSRLEMEGASAIHAVTPSGHTRLVARFAGMNAIHDVSGDGRVLMARHGNRTSIMTRVHREESERDLSWHDSSDLIDFSADGRTLLFDETLFGGGPGGGIYLRKTDGSPAVRLGQGKALALSPDGKWVLSIVRGTREFVLLPTGAGEANRIPFDVVDRLLGAGWFSDAKRFVFAGHVPGKGGGLFVQDLAGGPPRPLSASDLDLRFPLVSPDGRFVAAADAEGRVVLQPSEGGEARVVEAVEPGEIPIQWSADSRSLYVYRPFELPAKVVQVDAVGAGRRQWKEVAIADPTAVWVPITVFVTPDGQSYAYSFTRSPSELFLVEGLR